MIKITLVAAIATLFLVSCGNGIENPFAKGSEPKGYEVLGNCGWSDFLRCRACEVRFDDNTRGDKCQR